MGGASKKLEEATAADDEAEEVLSKEQKGNLINCEQNHEHIITNFMFYTIN